MSADGFPDFWLFVKKIPFKVSSCFYEIIIMKILPVTLFLELFAAFSKSPTTLKMLPETAYGPDKGTENLLHPMRGGHCRKSPMTEKECRN
jgi:hypothetical protein